MRTLASSCILIVVAALLVLGQPAPTRATAQSARGSSTLVLIVSRELGLRDISMPTLRRAFRGDPTEANGRRLVPFNYAPDSSLRRAFDLNALGMSSQEIGRYWIDRRIRGQGLPPLTVPTQAMLRLVVARLPGAIGYVTADQLDDTVQPLRVDGRSHHDPSYALQGAL